MSIDDITKLNKIVHPELNGACYICGINPSELLQLVLDVIGADEKITTNDGFGNEYEIDSPLNELRADVS